MAGRTGACTFVFLYFCMHLPIQAQERHREKLNSGLARVRVTAVCARCLQRTQRASSLLNGVDKQKSLIFHDLDKKYIKFPDFQFLE